VKQVCADSVQFLCLLYVGRLYRLRLLIQT
jgi:hypothetical protein